MITKSIRTYTIAGLLCCGAAAALTACSDTWDDHYDSLGGSTVHDGTLWQAIKSDANLSNFARVVEACDYAKSLDGSQVFTVFAPTNDNFSSADAQALIDDYNTQVNAQVLEEDNTVIKEFIQNHIALYNHSVSSVSNDSIVLMNGKYAVLSDTDIDGVPMQTKNQLYGNGVLYTIGNRLSYMDNVFEYLRKDADLDSLRSFLYNSHFYYKQFMPALSVPGSIVNGKTEYLDSVFRQQNELFDYLGLLSTEDSTYYMVAPTNAVWRQLIEEYEPYFDYAEGVSDRDSLAYTEPRLAIAQGTTFSATFNTPETLPDSAMSTNAMRNYSYRSLLYGAPFNYYEYLLPLATGGAFDQPQSDIVECSNGQVRKAAQWNIDKLMTFHQWKVINATSRNSIKELSKVADAHGDSITTITATTAYVTTDNRDFYDRVWDNSFVEFVPAVSTVNHSVEFNISNVLSNIGYDIYLVTAPALASDSNATEQQRLPTVMRATMNCPGKAAEPLVNTLSDTADDLNFVTTPDKIDYLLLASDYKFDHCTYGVEDESQQVTLKVETRVTSSQLRNQVYTRTMRINCILLVPHGTLALADDMGEYSSDYAGQPGIVMAPHGIDSRVAERNRVWYMLR